MQVTSENDFLLFPTPTANLGTYRQAGTNRLETWLRGNGLILNGSQLNAIAYALIQGFPSNWFQALAHPQNTLPIGLLVPHIRPAESEPESLQAEPSPPHRRPSPSSESCTSTHCSNCNSFDNSIPDSSPWKFCLLKGSYTKESDLTTCEDFIPVIPYEAPRKLADSKAKGQAISELASPMTPTNTITTLNFGKTENGSSSQRPTFPRANSPKFVRWKPIRNPLKQFSENLASKFQPMESLLGVTFNVKTFTTG